MLWVSLGILMAVGGETINFSCSLQVNELMHRISGKLD